MSASVRLRHRRSEGGHAHVIRALDALGFDHTPEKGSYTLHGPEQERGKNRVYTPDVQPQKGGLEQAPGKVQV